MTNRSAIPVEERGANRRPSGLSRRNFIAASTGLAGAIAADLAAADSLADVPPREVGADLGGHSERSQYVKISRIPEAGPGKRNVDPGDAINSKAPLDRLFGSITPSDLHYERSHSGVPDIDPVKHRLLVHGMVRKPLVLNVDDLKANAVGVARGLHRMHRQWLGELEEGRREPHRPEHARSGRAA